MKDEVAKIPGALGEIASKLRGMIATTRMPELVAFLATVLLYGGILWFLRQRFLGKLEAVFSRHARDKPTLAEVRRILDELNLDAAHHVFTTERRANIVFRGKEVTLVYGRVGVRSPGGLRGPVWTLRKTVYALADERQSAWMKEHPKIFRRALSAYRFSVFGVKLEALLSASD